MNAPDKQTGDGSSRSSTYTLVDPIEPTADGRTMALLALSHTPVEHRLYQRMLAETSPSRPRVGSFTTRGLMTLTGLNSFSTIRRACNGLIGKLSIECRSVVLNEGGQKSNSYLIFTPEEIFARRQAAGLEQYPKSLAPSGKSLAFSEAVGLVLEQHSLSRRECQVALCCAQGLSNSESGARLSINEETVKYHLRNIFAKFGIKRRAELISYLLSRDVN